VSQIKVRIQRARVAVRGMSDVERSIEEQEEEIRELEGCIERQRGVLRGLAEGGVERMDED
jgi:RNA polymerase II transcription mediator complex subunit 9